jgi:hypothetical protein
MKINGSDRQFPTFEIVLRYATLLAYAEGAHAVPTATIAYAHHESSNGDEDGQSVLMQYVVGDANADNNAVGGVNGDDVPWGAWGPRATAVSERLRLGWLHSLGVVGERRITVERNVGQICIRDYNPYRIQQARASMMAKGFRGHGWGDSNEEGDERGGNADTFHPKVTRRIIEKTTTQRKGFFEEDVTTALPHLETKIDEPGCRAIYVEQDKILIRVNDLDKVSGVYSCDRLIIGLDRIWLIVFVR